MNPGRTRTEGRARADPQLEDSGGRGARVPPQGAGGCHQEEPRDEAAARGQGATGELVIYKKYIKSLN